MKTNEQFVGMGVSGGDGSGKFVEYSEGNQNLFAGAVVLLSDLDKRVAELSEASGIISLAGSITSHGAVLAREFGIPCVIMDASDTLRGLVGQTVQVDGWEGILTAVEAGG